MPTYQINGDSAVPIWAFNASGNPPGNLLLNNLSDTQNITIGNAPGIQSFDTSAYAVLPPNGTISIPTNYNWYAISDDTDPSTSFLAVYPGASNWSPSSTGIANAIINSGLAEQVAEAITGSGIPLLGNPVQLYKVGPSGTGTDTGIFGATIYGLGTGVGGNITAFENIVSRTPTSMKVFNVKLPLTATDIANNAYIQYAIANPGFRVCLGFKPPLSPSSTDLANFTTTMANLATAGLTDYVINLWQEPQENGVTAAQYIAGYAAYYPTIHAGGIKVVSDISGSWGKDTSESWTAYDVYPNCDIYALDIYAQGYITYGNDPQLFANLAHSRGKPWGIWETGVGHNPPTETQVIEFLEYVQSILAADLQAGLPIDAWQWYFNSNLRDNNDPTPYVTQIQAIADTLTGGGTAAPIPGGSGIAVSPLQKSPNAGYANAEGISYDIVIKLTAGASSTNPSARVRLYWFNDDDPNAHAVDIQQWECPMGTNGSSGTTITGRGPQRGRYLKIQINNDDTVPCTYSIEVNSTSRSVNTNRWIWDVNNSVNVPGYTLAPDGVGFANNIGAVQARSVPANGSLVYLCGMYAGQIYARVESGASGNFITASLRPWPDSKFNTSKYFNELVDAATSSNLGDFEQIFFSERAPMLLEFDNSDSVAHTVYAHITYLEDT